MDDDTSSSSSEGDYRGAVAFRYDASLLAADPNDPDQPSTSGGNAATSEQAARMPPNLKSGGVDVLRQPVQLSGFVATRPEQFRSHDYKSERERLESFAGFPSMTVDVRQLAAAGFWYTKCEDIVRCAFCNVEVGRWEEGDDPMVEHHKWSKNCSFLKHVDVGNVPVDPSNPPPLPSLEQTGFDECGIYNIKKSDNCPIIPSLERLGIQKRYTPAHPEFTTLEARLQSFNSWPIGLKLKPQELAEAGFFYTGLGDKTVCFQCGGGLKDWAESDEPWREHALYFSKCAFVVQTKGREFVAEVLGKRPPTLSPEEIRALAIPKEYSSILHQRPQAVGHSTSPAETAQTSSGSSGINPCPEDTPSNANQPKKLDDARACKICFSEEIGVAFLPCGHLVSCVNCVSSLTTCAVCRKPFSATVRVFMS